MSSNIRVLKICEYCKNEFIARKTTSKTCSDACVKRLYKQRKKEEKINKVLLENKIKKNPQNFIKEDEIKAIQAKELLTLIEAAILLNITPLTLRRWILAGKIPSIKIGKKHVLNKATLNALIDNKN